MNRRLLLILLLSLILLPSNAHGALTDSLISYWALDEASGGRIDAHLTNDLTDNNTTGSATAIINDGADFERGNSEYLSILDASQTGLDFSSNITIAFWVKLESEPTGTGGDGFTITSKVGVDTNQQFQLVYDNNGGTKRFIFVAYDNGNCTDNKNFTINHTLSVGDFHYVVVTYNLSTNTLQIYVDNTSIGTTTGSGTVDAWCNSANPFYISSTGDGQYVDGVIDEFAIWARILTTDELTELYADGSGFGYPFSDEPDPVVATTTVSILYADYALGLGIIVFLISFPVWGTMWGIFRKKPEEND